MLSIRFGKLLILLITIVVIAAVITVFSDSAVPLVSGLIVAVGAIVGWFARSVVGEELDLADTFKLCTYMRGSGAYDRAASRLSDDR